MQQAHPSPAPGVQLSAAMPLVPNGFATGSPHIPNQTLAGLYGVPPADATATPDPTRRPSMSAYAAAAAAGNVLPVATIPSAAQGLQLGGQVQQQALLHRNQQAGPPPFPAAAPPLALPARRPPGPPAAPVIERSDLDDQDGPEWKVPLRRSTTSIRATAPGEEFPTVSVQDQHRIKRWMERDAAYEDEVLAASYDLRLSMQTLFNQAAREQDWLGYPADPQQRGPPRIQFPSDRRAELAKGTRGPYRKPVPLYVRALFNLRERGALRQRTCLLTQTPLCSNECLGQSPTPVPLRRTGKCWFRYGSNSSGKCTSYGIPSRGTWPVRAPPL